MALATKRGSFVANVATGNQAISGLGFQPKAVLFLSASLTAVGDATGPTGTTGPQDLIGAAVSSSEQFCLSRASQHNVAASNSHSRLDTVCLSGDTPGGLGVDFAASFVSMDADGFTVNWTNAPGSAILIEYLALGGSGLSAFIGSDAVRTTVGNESITGVGFEPKALMFATIALQSGLPHSLAGAPFNIGMATSASQRGSVGLNDNDNQNPTTVQSKQAQKALTALAAASQDWEIELVSMDADGFTYNVTDAPNAADFYVYLALGGADLEAALVTDTQKTSTGTQVNNSVGFEPMALIALSRQEATAFDGSVVTNQNARLVVGFRDETTEACIWNSADDAVTPTVVGRAHSQTKFIQFRNSARAVLAECDVSALGSSGYTLDWTTADATARHIIVLALGVPGAQALTEGGGIASEEAFGVGTIGYPQHLTDGGEIDSEEAFGVGTIQRGTPAPSARMSMII